MKIKEIRFKDIWGNPCTYTVGGGLTKIEEHKAQREGDRWYYDVYFSSEVIRIFAPAEVVLELPKP